LLDFFNGARVHPEAPFFFGTSHGLRLRVADHARPTRRATLFVYRPGPQPSVDLLDIPKALVCFSHYSRQRERPPLPPRTQHIAAHSIPHRGSHRIEPNFFIASRHGILSCLVTTGLKNKQSLSCRPSNNYCTNYSTRKPLPPHCQTRQNPNEIGTWASPKYF
jgi:hypothetical protein